MIDLREVEPRQRGVRCCSPQLQTSLDADAAQQLSDDLQILGHPIRLQILDILARNEGLTCVCDLEAALPVKQPTVSHHLKLLRSAGLIDSERQGLWAYYYVRRDALAALRERVTGLLESLG